MKVDLKKEYNKTLAKYYQGCNYLFDNPDKIDKYSAVLKQLIDKLNSITNLIENMTEEEILNGFKT